MKVQRLNPGQSLSNACNDIGPHPGLRASVRTQMMAPHGLIAKDVTLPSPRAAPLCGCRGRPGASWPRQRGASACRQRRHQAAAAALVQDLLLQGQWERKSQRGGGAVAVRDQLLQGQWERKSQRGGGGRSCARPAAAGTVGEEESEGGGGSSCARPAAAGTVGEEESEGGGQ